MNVQTQIEENLGKELQPQWLEVSNESHMHSVPPNSETHFKVVIVSAQFDGKRKVARHQRVYAALQAQLDAGVHALALHTYSPEEWQTKQNGAPDSPDCKGGSRH